MLINFCLFLSVNLSIITEVSAKQSEGQRKNFPPLHDLKKSNCCKDQNLCADTSTVAKPG